jgi:A-macroglobulin TED domain/Alpha-2-macroglobulin family/Carboxypeptidase regulatory-like domain/A-macroglobulin receptor binding domain/MG2 domain/Alpha-2-macroglobulin bait region domain
MDYSNRYQDPLRFAVLMLVVFLTIGWFVARKPFQASPGTPSLVATYSQGVLHMTIPYEGLRAGAGRLTMEVLDPENDVLGRQERRVEVTEARGQWQDEIKLDHALSSEDLVWHRLRYRLEYEETKAVALERTESISQILRRPVVHILGQQSYLTGGQAAVRVIVTDSKDEVIAGRGSVDIELLADNKKPRLLFHGLLNRRGTTEAQFRFPAGLVGNYHLHYVADTPIGSTDFTQDVRLEDKVSILLTSEKPLYQPGQMIHVRALALDRSDHEAAAKHRLTFELEDSRGNKVFKKVTATDQFGVASAEFGLADEVNLGTYHLRALMGDADAPSNTAEIALDVERYVLPKFKVAVELSQSGKKAKRGYQPGDHVTGTVRANYFFGKPVDNAELTMKASAMDVAVVEVASLKGKTDSEGAYHFDLPLPKYFAGKPLNHGAARVLVEATVKDSAGHSETRGEPITVSDSPLLITAIPEGGTLVPNLENEVFVLTSYADGTPAKADLSLRYAEGSDQHLRTDEGGVAVARVMARRVTTASCCKRMEIQATDQEGNHASTTIELEERDGEDQILLRTERAVYHAGDQIRLQVFSTKKRGAAYVDIVKEGQTVVTRDLDLINGQSELTLAATPEMAGTVDVSAYLFGRDARPVGDHRLIFVQPADELKIQAASDASVYKPGGDARIKFRVTNSHGEGVHAALGLQVVDEAVFALAEKQPGFAKVFFYLEQEVMKPRYEIHSIGMPEVVEPAEKSQAEQHDRAARALFSATEIVNANNFETEFGKGVPMTKYAEYWRRYQLQFQTQANQLAKELNAVYRKNPDAGDLSEVYAKIARSGSAEFRDPWGNGLIFEPAHWDLSKKYYLLRSAGPDRTPNTVDDLQAVLLFERKWIAGPPGPESTKINLNIEHDRGPFNRQTEIVGTVSDPTGAVVPGAKVELRSISNGKTHPATTDHAGQFNFSGLSSGDYVVQVSMAGFKSATSQFTLRARDRAVLSAVLSLGQVSEVVAVRGPVGQVQITAAGVIGGVAGGIAGGVFNRSPQPFAREMLDRDVSELEVVDQVQSNAVLVKEGSAPASHVRSYFPEALYINPEIITDKGGHASIMIPLADSITTWRLAMIASTPQGALGTSSSSLKVFQDFFVDLDLPITLTQGDRVSIPVAIYNYSDSADQVNLKLQPDDWFALVDDVAEKSVSIEKARVGGSQFTVEAKRIGKFKLTLSARMQGAADRADIVVREIEVVPNGREQSLVFNGHLENTVQHEITFPTNSIPEASKIFVRLYPGPMSQVVEGMDSILRMPNGCFEQTSSSTYPNVLALDYMKRTKKLTPEVHAKAEGYIANGYQRLLTFEVPGGGFSWFGSAPANKILTAYGLMEFYDMSKVYDVDPKLIARTQQWLASQQQEDGSWKPDAQFINEGATNRYNSDVLRITAYLAWSLKDTGYQGGPVEKAKQFVEAHMKAKVDTYTLAVVANFAADYGDDRDFTRQAIQLLLDARREKDELVWWDAEETSVYATGPSASVETTGLAVQALLQWGQAPGVARKALNYLAAKKDAYGTWGTTQATIMALRALLSATEKGAADVHGTLLVLVNGNPREKLELTSDNNDLLHQFVFKDIDSKGRSTVEIRFEGNGGLAYQIVGSYFLPWEATRVDEPLSIDVAYDRTHLTQDDIARATATVRNNLNKAANMVMVDLGIPPGFDLLSEDLQDYQEKSANHKSGHLSKFSLTATQAILYFDSFAPGDSVRLTFRLRAKYPIRARTFESRVYEYYDPEISSVARPVQLEVSGR